MDEEYNKKGYQSLREELKGDINTALNRIMLYFTGLAPLLALLTLWR
ncbi:hypothetical protein [Thermus scotoductus]|nr:hypothetical protein [Thermus scotoductus]